MITNKEIEEWLAAIPVSDFDGVEAKRVYSTIAEIAYRKGVEAAANICEQRAEALPYEQCVVARQCKRDVMSLLLITKGE